MNAAAASSRRAGCARKVPAATLHDLAAEFNVSAERIRQIEQKAMSKMHTTLAQAAA